MGDEEDLYFILRKGEVWACWLSGKPAIPLGPEAEFRAAISQFSDTPAAQEANKSRLQNPPQELEQSKSPQLQVDRIEPRHETTIVGRVFAVGGSREVTILDLSEKGCRFYDLSQKLGLGHHITVKMGPVGPVEAIVRWRKGDTVGVQFTTPLYPSVLDHIRTSFDLRNK